MPCPDRHLLGAQWGHKLAIEGQTAEVWLGGLSEPFKPTWDAAPRLFVPQSPLLPIRFNLAGDLHI